MENNKFQLMLVTKLFEQMQEMLEKGIDLYTPKFAVSRDIVYCNINGPTDFNWEYYNKTCLFALPFEGSVKVFMNCFLDKDGIVEMNFYPSGESVSAAMVTEKWMSNEEAQLVYEWLLENTDNKGMWNPTINEIIQGIKREARGIEIEDLLKAICEYEQLEADEDSINLKN